MRKLSPNALAKTTQQYASEPINLVNIQWKLGGDLAFYASKEIGKDKLDAIFLHPDFAEQHVTLDNNILAINTLSASTQIDGSSTVSQVSITFDDRDKKLKQILDTTDIHRRPVYIYQAWADLGLEDMFLIFEGEVSSPIVWNEKERTVTINTVTQVKNVEIGFSPESANMFNLHEDLIGLAWPMPFGAVLYYEAVPLQVIPIGSTVNPFGIDDATIDLQRQSLSDQMNQDLADAAINLFNAGLALANGDQDAADAFNETALADQNQANEIQADLSTLSGSQQQQKTWVKSTNFIVNGDRFPNGPLVLKVGETLFNATVDAKPGQDGTARVNWTPIKIKGGPVIQRDDQGNIVATLSIEKQGFVFFQAGTHVQIIKGISPEYVISIVPLATTPIICAYRNANGVRRLVPIPQRYYKIVNHGFYQTVKFDKPMSSVSFYNNLRTIDIDDYLVDITKDTGLPRPTHILSGSTWEDQPYVVCVSSIGPNPVDIIIYIIQTYTQKDYDRDSFNAVKNIMANYPNNFVVQDRPDAISFINSIAYQNRCAVWLEQDIFYIVYLAKEPDSVMTLTLDDVLEDSLEVTYTPTEQLITKYVALWRPDYEHQNQNRLILQHNVQKYGLIEEQYDYFALNNYDLVNKSATFWMIRKSNTWKLVTAKFMLTAVPLQIFDGVTLDFGDQQNLISNNPVKAVVQDISYDSAEKTVTITFWLPIRLGEMDPEPLAWPAGISSAVFFPYFADIQSGNAGSGSGVQNNTATLPQYHDTVTTVNPDHVGPLDYGDNSPSDTGDGPYANVLPSFESHPQNANVDDYQYRTFPPVPPAKVLPGSYPGFIQKKLSRYRYQVTTYFQQFDPENRQGGVTVTATQLSIDASETIPVGTPVHVVRQVLKDGSIQTTINVPTWRE